MADKYISDESIHYGHRSRMRSKLIAHGAKIFDTYELLEMLLYHTVPLKDTNPIAKRLLCAFSSLDGVMTADELSLLGVCGVGERTVGLIKTVGHLKAVLDTEITDEDKNCFSGYAETADFLISKLGADREKKVVAMYLDNSMRLIAYEEVAVGIDYDSAGIKARVFIDGALRHCASVVITAHNHPFGSRYPTPADRETNRLVTSALEAINVIHAEHYVICGDSFSGMMCRLGKRLSQSTAFTEFEEERAHFESDAGIEHLVAESCADQEKLCCDYLSGLLSFALGEGDAHGAAESLLKKYSSVRNVIDTDVESLIEILGEKAAVLLKLAAYLTSRRVTDGYAFMKKHKPAETVEYCKALYIGTSVETVYLICFDEAGRVTACTEIAEGTVNYSDVVPRRLLEAAFRAHARSVILVHNHPFGVVKPSADDLRLTVELTDLLLASGIVLSEHLVVAGQKCEPINIGVGKF